eukprot:gi/632970316/ref/XP_007901581.1/ PREDICTED: uncharacterized protein LOC103185057 [Callorhinchus milii]
MLSSSTNSHSYCELKLTNHLVVFSAACGKVRLLGRAAPPGGRQVCAPGERRGGAGEVDRNSHSLNLPTPSDAVGISAETPVKRQPDRGTDREVLSPQLDATSSHQTVGDVSDGSVDTAVDDDSGQETEEESTWLKWGSLALTLEAAPECEVSTEGCPGQTGGEPGGWSDTGDTLGPVDPQEEIIRAPESDQAAVNVDVTLDDKQITRPEAADEDGLRWTEASDQVQADSFTEAHKELTPDASITAEANGEIDSFQSPQGVGDGVGFSPQPKALGQGVAPNIEQGQGERRDISGSSAPTLEDLTEEIAGIRQNEAWSQTEIRLLVRKLEESSCQVDSLQRELATERERTGLYVERMGVLEREVGGSSALAEVLSECRCKVEQFEELKESSEELVYKFQESKETAVHLRERITELESQNVIKERRIKELRHQLSECRKTVEIAPVPRQASTLNGSGLEMVEEETPKQRCSSRRNGHAVSASTQPQRRQSAAHSAQPPTDTTKVCIIL